MNDASKIDDGSVLSFHLTGGEPFLNFPLLIESVAHGARLGAEVTCVTNAYWAKTPETAFEKLKSLKAAGLASLGVSVSRFHEQYVPRRNARLALEAAKALNLPTELKGAVITSDLKEGGLLETWKRELDADEINITPVIPNLRSGTYLADAEYYRQPGLPKQRCPGAIACIEADGVVMSCCGQSPQTGFLEIGHINADSLATLQTRLVNSGKQRILRERGPIAFAKKAISAGLKHVLRAGYAGPCDLCVHIATDPALRGVAEAMASEYQSKMKSAKAEEGCAPIQVHKPTPAMLARRLQMTEKELENLKDVLTEAATNSKFRALLLENPEPAAKEFLGMEPSDTILQILISVSPDVRSVGEHGTLQHSEAQNWAIGLIVMTTTRRLDKNWKIAITDIPRYNKKKKKKDFNVRIDDIPRLKKRVGVQDSNRKNPKPKTSKNAVKPAAKPK
jgi:hypothetical protein